MEVIIMNTIKNQIRSAVIALTISSLLFAGSAQALDLNYASLKAKALEKFDVVKNLVLADKRKSAAIGVSVIALIAAGVIAYFARTKKQDVVEVDNEKTVVQLNENENYVQLIQSYRPNSHGNEQNYGNMNDIVIPKIPKNSNNLLESTILSQDDTITKINYRDYQLIHLGGKTWHALRRQDYDSEEKPKQFFALENGKDYIFYGN